MVNTIHPVDATAGAPAYGGRMLRQVGSVAFAGATAARPFDVRSGVRPGTSTTTVTATSATWTVGPHAGVLGLEAAMEAGGTPYAIDAAVSGALRAADAFARVDLVWVRQDIPLEDGAAVPAVVPGYTFGTVAGTPPALPARCMLLAWVNVPASGGGAPTVTWKATALAAAGAPIPVWSQAERDALVAYDGLQVYRLDTHTVETYNSARAAWAGGAWVTYTPTLTDFSLGSGSMAVQYRLEGLDLVRVRYLFTLVTGSMTQPKFTLPFTSIALRHTFEVVGVGSLAIGAGRYMSVVDLISASTAQINYLGTSGLLSDVTLTTPAAWSNWDSLAGEFTYRAA